MADVRAEDILKPRWNPAYQGRARTLFIVLGLASLVFAVAGWFVTQRLLDGHPVAGLFLAIFPAIGGLKFLAAAVAITFWRAIGRFLMIFAAPIFFSGVIGGVVFVWALSLLFAYVNSISAADLKREAAGGVVATTCFGGVLTAKEIQEALPEVAQCQYVSTILWPFQFQIVRDVILLVGIVSFVSILAMYTIWWERKVAGRIQSRLGPMRVGKWHGWAQSMADGIKLVCKEDLVPAGADGPLFRLAPYLTFAPALSAFIALPFATYWVVRNLDIGLLFILAMLGLEVIGVIVAGWASNNKWSLYGGIREACQMVSYEIPMGMTLLIPVMAAGSLNLVKIGDLQTGGWHTWLAFQNPFLFVAFVCYFIASLASCKRAPFDLPEAESELVAGFLTEYSGIRWSMFFFAEYAAMFVVSGLATVLFLGAWHSPIPACWGSSLAGGPLWKQAIHGMLFSGPLWFIAKSMFLIYVQIWLRWTLPRVRIDQVLYACVQVLLPLAMVLLLGNTLWQLWVVPGGAVAVAANILMSLVGAVFVAGFIVIMMYGWLNRRRLVGSLVIDHLPGS